MSKPIRRPQRKKVRDIAVGGGEAARPRFQPSPLNASISSKCSSTASRPPCWIAGHTLIVIGELFGAPDTGEADVHRAREPAEQFIAARGFAARPRAAPTRRLPNRSAT